MSRIGKTPIELPKGVTADVTADSHYSDMPPGGDVLQYLLVAHCGAQSSQAECWADLTPWFIRGEVNDDGAVDLADAVYLLGALFPTGTPNNITCENAADANDDGAINLADAITILYSLFGSPATPLPEPSYCGNDPTPLDGLGCNYQLTCPPPP